MDGDEVITEADLGRTAEARAYIENEEGAVWTEDLSGEELKAFIDALYRAGADKVMFAGIEDFEGVDLTAWLVVRLPPVERLRAPVFAAFNRVLGERDEAWEPIRDTGQKFLDLPLD